MQRLYTARDRIEAQLVADHLDRHLLRVTVLGDYLAGAVGELPADLAPSVWLIDDADLDRARALLDAFLSERARPPGDSGPWVCAACGERVEDDFDLCWNCGHPRDPS
jgi:hypothetical protein